MTDPILNTLPNAIRDALDAKDAKLGGIITEMMGLRGNPSGLETAIEKANGHLHESDNAAVATKIAEDFAPKPEEKRADAPKPAEAAPETKPDVAATEKSEEPPVPAENTSGKRGAGKPNDHRL